LQLGCVCKLTTWVNARYSWMGLSQV